MNCKVCGAPRRRRISWSGHSASHLCTRCGRVWSKFRSRHRKSLRSWRRKSPDAEGELFKAFVAAAKNEMKA